MQICATSADIVQGKVATMARRGGNLFKRNDGLRALKIARDGGIEPAMIEIIAKDGTVFRVYGDKAAPQADAKPKTAGGKDEWADAIAELKAEQKKGR
jgi:hypothetical protein